MPSLPGSTGPPPGHSGALQVLVDPTEGTGRLQVLGAAWPALAAHGGPGAGYLAYDVATFRAPPWGSTGRIPVYWDYQADPTRQRNILYLVAGPEVELSYDAIDTALRLPDHLAPEVRIIRVQSASQVPPSGTPLRLSEMVGQPERLVNGYDPDSGQEPPPWSETFVHDVIGLPSIERATIHPEPTGVTITHSFGHWQCRILAPVDTPARFAYEVVHSRGENPFSRSVFRLRVVRSAGVQIDGFETTVAAGGHLVSRVFIDDAMVDLSDVPAQGTPLQAGYRFTPYRGFSERVTVANVYAAGAELVVSATPILGSLFDLAHLKHKVATGQTYWGEKVSSDQMIADAVFAMLGPIGDAGDVLNTLRKVAGALAPGDTLMTAGRVAPWLSGSARVTCDPHLLASVESLGPGELRPVLDDLEATVAGRARVGQLADTVHRVLLPALDDTLASGVIPTGVYREAFGTIHPAHLEGFDDLRPVTRDKILDAFRRIPQEVAAVGEVARELEVVLPDALSQAMDQWRVWKAFDLTLDGFEPRAHLLARGFHRYRVTGRGDKNAIQWAISQTTGRYVAELERLLGRDYRTLLKRVAPDKWLEITGAARAHFLQHGNRPYFYRDLATVNKGYGHLFEADHILEKRLVRYHPRFEDLLIHFDDFQAILVPKNPAVAAGLGVPSDYDHLTKTRALARLIPHGLEDSYSLQEIYDAYMLVYLHELTMDPRDFLDLTADIFAELARVSRQKVDLTLVLDPALIHARSPSFARLP